MKRRRPPKLAPIPAHMTTGHYFTALIRAHDWPPGWRPAAPERKLNGGAALIGTRRGIEERERQAAEGIGWGSGTTPQPNTPKNRRPEWMNRRKGE